MFSLCIASNLDCIDFTDKIEVCKVKIIECRYYKACMTKTFEEV